MIPPALPIDETERLSSLHALQILDTPPEERFDRITRMTKRMFGVDICLVSLVDEHRQWFKSSQGLDACETSRKISFCGHAILAADILVVNDARNDDRFADNPLVTGDPLIRFYAGCPIREPGGHLIGTLCLIDPEAREFSGADAEMLGDLAALIEDELAVTAQATVDDLTQIANRRGFNTMSGHLLSLCRRTGLTAELLFFDLDGFKEVNDDLGHAAGDDVLRHFAGLLMKSFRSADVIARMGGDEFAVLMAASDPASDAALERLNSFATAEECAVLSRVSWSVGRVVFDPQRHRTVDDLLAQADSRMYTDKQRRQDAAG